MKRSISAMFFLILSLCAYSTSDSLRYSYIVPKDYYVEIPYETLGQLPIINVTIEGVVYRFLFDTGAVTSISSDLLKAIAHDDQSSVLVSDANDVVDSLELVIFESMDIGGVELKNIRALVLDAKLLAMRCFDMDGIIGSDILKESVIQFSSPDKVIRLSNSIKPMGVKRRNARKLTLFGAQNLPTFWVEMKGQQTRMIHLIFDTGMRGLLDIASRHFEYLQRYAIGENIKQAYGCFDYGLYGAARDTLHHQMTLPELGLGKVSLYNASVFTTRANNSRLGSDVLQYATVTLDYRKEKVYFCPIDTVSTEAYLPQFPLRPIYRDGKYLVGIIWDADKVPHIHVGDDIVSVGDICCQALDSCDLIVNLDLWQRSRLEIVTKTATGEQYTSHIVRE